MERQDAERLLHDPALGLGDEAPVGGVALHDLHVPTSPGHVGMYIGDGLVVQAPETGLDIMITPLDGYWSTNAVARRRIVL